MFFLCGYDFCRDGNALNPSPLSPSVYKTVELTNGIFSHWNVTRDITVPYSPDEPTAWDYLTIMDANFNGTIEAGNVGYDLSQIEGIKVKRRKVDDYNWITIKYIPVGDLEEDLAFSLNDNTAQNGIEYEYAFVPVVSGIEGNYITNTIKSNFDGVFICDKDIIYKFYAGVNYGTNQRVQKIGVFEPLGRKYPVVISNSLINYETGSFSGTVLPNDYLTNKDLDKISMVKERKDLLDFLTNKQPKILKDWNGNIWLMVITGNPNVSFQRDSAMKIADVSANWTEIGDYNNQKDLYEAGFVAEEV